MTSRGLFIDLDGTLADSLPVMRRVYHRFLAEQGKSSSDAEFDRLNGPPLAEVVAILIRVHGLGPGKDELMSRYLALIADAYREVPPHEGAEDLLDAARRLGMRTAVVTSNSHALASAWLTATGLASWIDGMVAGDEVTAGKPHPEPYLTALRRLGCEPDGSLAVEDSAAGAASAMAAGIPTLLLAPRATAPIRAIGCLADAIPYLRIRSEA